MPEVTPLYTDSSRNIPAVPIHALPEDEERLQATLEQRIFNIVGKELLEKAFKPTAYAMAVLKSGGDPNQIIYHYTKIRYNDLYERASRRIKHNNEIKV